MLSTNRKNKNEPVKWIAAGKFVLRFALSCNTLKHAHNQLTAYLKTYICTYA